MRNRTLGFVLGVLLTLSFGASPAGAEPVTVTTANIYVGLRPPAARHDLRLARDGSQVVVAQEMYKRNARAFAPASWGVWQPRGPGLCREIAVYWLRSRFVQVSHSAKVLARSGLRKGTRCVAVSVLKERSTGRLLPVVGIHMIPHVEIGGHPRACCPARVRTYSRGMQTMESLGRNLRERYGRLLVGGDWNVGFWADRRVQFRGFPYAHLHPFMNSIGSIPRPRATRGTRHIDTWWWSENMRGVWSRTLRNTRSDHNFSRTRVTW